MLNAFLKNIIEMFSYFFFFFPNFFSQPKLLMYQYCLYFILVSANLLNVII